MSRFRCHVTCDYVTKRHVHCNVTETIRFDNPDNLIEKLEKQGWIIKENETICPQCG